MEDPRARQVILSRDSDLSFLELVEDNAIVLWDLGKNAGDDLKAMQSRVVFRRLWSAVKTIDARRSHASNESGDPGADGSPDTYLFLDESDLMFEGGNSGGSASVSGKTLENALSKGRSMGLSIILCAQYPSQLPDNVLQSVYTNSDTICSFRAKGRDARLLGELLDVEPKTLREKPYHVWMALFVERTGDLSDAFRAYVIPAPPKLRSNEIVKKIKDDIIEAKGTPRKSNQQTRSELKFSGTGGETSDDIGSVDHSSLYKTIYDSQIIHSDDPLDPQPIGQDETEAALRVTLASLGDKDPDQVAESQIHSVTDQLRRRHLVQTDDYRYFVAPDGQAFLDQDSPERADPRAGHQQHRRGVDHAYHWLVHFFEDCDVSIPNQGGETPDLHIDDPFELSGSALSARKQRQTFEADHPLRATITGGAPTAVEFEHTTKEKTSSLIGKVTRTYESDEACLFVTWSTDDARTVYTKLSSAESGEIPSDAHWHILVLPTGDSTAPELYLGPDADPSTIPLSDVSPQAVDDALTSDLFDF
jgi:hypothetical protein